jgi:hypothetical protein
MISAGGSGGLEGEVWAKANELRSDNIPIKGKRFFIADLTS